MRLEAKSRILIKWKWYEQYDAPLAAVVHVWFFL